MEDAELVNRIRDGDRKAFDLLYERYSQGLYRTARFICQDEALAQDALQDTFVTCWLEIGKLRDPGKVKPWLLQILTRRARRMMGERKDIPHPWRESLWMPESSGRTQGRCWRTWPFIR